MSVSCPFFVSFLWIAHNFVVADGHPGGSLQVCGQGCSCEGHDPEQAAASGSGPLTQEGDLISAGLHGRSQPRLFHTMSPVQR